MSRIFRAYDADTGESELEMYEVPEGLCLAVWNRDHDEDSASVILPRDKALAMAAWLAARFAGRVPPEILRGFP